MKGALRNLGLFAFLISLSFSYGQETVVRGTVNDSANIPLPGVNISVKNSEEGSVTDFDGNFEIRAQSNDTLVASYVGFETLEVALNGRSSITIRLQTDSQQLSEVIVVGYGTQKKENLTGSVVSVSGEQLTERPAPNASNLLQGRVAGLQVTQASAEPGRDNPDFLIRGRGSFGASNAPLILIDGVSGSLNNLSPDNIEDITVLKDAASASIYGSRAANGMVLVTTKQGHKGKSTISYRVNYAIHTPTALPDLITNSADYMELYNQAATLNLNKIPDINFI